MDPDWLYCSLFDDVCTYCGRRASETGSSTLCLRCHSFDTARYAAQILGRVHTKLVVQLQRHGVEGLIRTMSGNLSRGELPAHRGILVSTHLLGNVETLLSGANEARTSEDY